MCMTFMHRTNYKTKAQHKCSNSKILFEHFVKFYFAPPENASRTTSGHFCNRVVLRNQKHENADVIALC